MGSLEVAQASALAFIAANIRPNLDHDVVIVDDLVREFEHYWCFPYDGARYVKFDDPVDVMAGNVPIVVEKATGKARFAEPDEFRYLFY